MRNYCFFKLLLLVCCTLFTSVAAAQEYKIATKPIAPFVIEKDGELSGFSVDLWREISKRSGIQSKLIFVPTLGELFDAVETGQADAAIAAVTITREREERFDFSHSYFDSGLQILTNAEGQGLAAQIWFALKSIFSSKEFLAGLGIFSAFVVIVSTLFWVLEHKHNQAISKRLLHGVGDAVWWSVVTVTSVGYGDKIPVTRWGRTIATVWIIFGYMGFAWFTAIVTSTVTVSQLTGTITGPESLSGKQVVAIKGSTGESWMRANIPGARIQLVNDSASALERVRNREAVAMIYDAPSLQFAVRNDQEGTFSLVGEPFKKEQYGIVFPTGSTLIERINKALLEIFEDGTHEEIRKKWFGSN